jgi:hypothetical protein
MVLLDWGAHAFRVLVAAFRRNGLSLKFVIFI